MRTLIIVLLIFIVCANAMERIVKSTDGTGEMPTKELEMAFQNPELYIRDLLQKRYAELEISRTDAQIDQAVQSYLTQYNSETSDAKKKARLEVLLAAIEKSNPDG